MLFLLADMAVIFWPCRKKEKYMKTKEKRCEDELILLFRLIYIIQLQLSVLSLEANKTVLMFFG